jgi:hypothetical protein
MPTSEIVYLVGVLGAIALFAIVIAWADRQTKPPAQESGRKRPF